MDENFRITAEGNLKQFMDRLHVETDPEQRELFRKLLLWEERWFGIKEERMEMLRRQLRDCDGRIRGLRGSMNQQSPADADNSEAGILMNNLVDIQAML